MWQEDEMAMMDEVFDAAAYVRARCEGGDVEELAAFALCCKADATRLGNMVGRIQRKLDAVIETRDAARKAFDEVLQQRQDALAKLTAEQESGALAEMERDRLAGEFDRLLALVVGAREERDRAVRERNELRDAISLARGERDSAITARNDARAEAEKAARECVEARLELGEMQRRVWAALGCNGDWLPSVAEMEARAKMLIGARDEAIALAERAVQEREDFGLRASAAVARAERAEKALADAAGVADRLGCRIVDLEAEVLCLQGERDRARAEIEEMRVELNSRVNEVNEARRLVRDLAEMTVSRDQIRDEAAMLRQRPTYEARTVAPTEEERGAHEAAGGLWLVRTNGGSFHVLKLWRGTLAIGVMPETCLPLGADGLPCAWPVVSLVKP
jgi:chromosome segregation ATPase